MDSFKRIMSYCRPYRKLLAALLALEFFGLGLSFIVTLVPYYFRGTEILDWNFIKAHQSTFYYIPLAFTGVYLLRAVHVYVTRLIAAVVSTRITAEVQKEVYDKYLELSMSYHNKGAIGEKLARMTYDVQGMTRITTMFFNEIVLYPFVFIGFPIILFVFSWRLALFGMTVYPLALVIMKFTGRALRRYQTRIQEYNAEITSAAQESFYGIHIVKAFVAESLEKLKVHGLLNCYADICIRSAKMSNLVRPLNTMMRAVTISLVGCFAALGVTSGWINKFDLLVFGLALWFIYKPISKSSQVWASVQTALACADRVFPVLDSNERIVEREGAVELGKFTDTIEFQDIVFGYEKGRPAIDHVSLNIKKGEVVALVGPSGAGKTTLVNLLLRFYDIESGAITVDGIDVKDSKTASLRGRMTLVSQETILFLGTIRENIAYGQPDATMDDVIKAAKAANAHEFIMQMPKQYETKLGERGIRLSGGERQRIAIARAMCRDADILILDEAMSSLDSFAENIIRTAMQQSNSERTVLLITHRLSTVSFADRIYVIKHGRIVEHGQHAELMAIPGLYRDLYELQFGGTEEA